MATIANPYTLADFDFAKNTFYGYRIDAATGRLTVEIVNDRSTIELPVDDVLKDNQYRTWIWTKNTLQFSWSGTKMTHLKMEIL
jgi:hypothetical protein